MRDVYLLLHDLKELEEDLNESTWKADHNASLHTDVDWRAGHIGIDANFWNLVDADMPWQLSEGLVRYPFRALSSLFLALRES